MQELETTAGTVIGSSLTNRAYTTSSDTTTWVTVLECGTAEGVRLSPTVVTAGQAHNPMTIVFGLNYSLSSIPSGTGRLDCQDVARGATNRSRGSEVQNI
ncbi:hypothetical protein N657DRAFT_324950 [Parathielavia appendiculata]|uniref:Uncharacterized protein n=1 Tax=Parathielavia appendiculata TaxID=2587402 RepID=A0AAN6TQP9_9PEZI|nr:hypothetical protein N657DRAFT_324950 [Parathielavia appendiculata]